MKRSLRTSRVLVFVGILGFVGLLGIRVFQFATRPNAIEWTEDTLRDRISTGQRRDNILAILGKPHSVEDEEHWLYWNSYQDVSISRSNKPKTFSIFFEGDRVSAVLSGPY